MIGGDCEHCGQPRPAGWFEAKTCSNRCAISLKKEKAAAASKKDTGWTAWDEKKQKDRNRRSSLRNMLPPKNEWERAADMEEFDQGQLGIDLK